MIKKPIKKNFLKTFLLQNLYQKRNKKNFLPMPILKYPKNKNKHTGTFSTDKNDLGWANHFEHKITTKNETPRYRKQFQIPEAHSVGIEQHIK